MKMASRVCALFLVVFSLAWAPGLSAKEPVKWTLTLGDPLRQELGPSEQRRDKLADEAVTRLKSRLETAGVSDAVVKKQPSGDLTVEFRPKQPLSWYKALLLSPGVIEFRPIFAHGFNWMSVAGELPADVEFRGDNPQPDYLWASERTPLELAVKRIMSNDFSFVVGPAERGWRTYTLGKSINGPDELKRVKVRKSSGGLAYVTFSVPTSMVDRLAAPELSEVKEWAIVLDGEVVQVVSRETLATGKLEMTAPQRLTSREDTAGWARQVAGRMAASMPIPIAVLQE